MQAGQLCGLDDLLRLGIFQPRNDVFYRFPDEVDVLRQISEMPAASQHRDVDVVEHNATHRWCGDSSDDPPELGLTRARRANDAKAITGRETERNALQQKIA